MSQDNPADDPLFFGSGGQFVAGLTRRDAFFLTALHGLLAGGSAWGQPTVERAVQTSQIALEAMPGARTPTPEPADPPKMERYTAVVIPKGMTVTPHPDVAALACNAALSEESVNGPAHTEPVKENSSARIIADLERERDDVRECAESLERQLEERKRRCAELYERITRLRNALVEVCRHTNEEGTRIVSAALQEDGK